MTHLECNPQVMDQLSTQRGLHRHESEVQMGISQSHLHPLPQSFQGTQNPDPQRVLPGVWLPPQIRYPSAQWSSAPKAHLPAQNTSPELPGQGDLGAQSDLGGRRLPVLPTPQGSSAAVAALGTKALFPLCPTPKATAFDQPLHHRPAAQGQKTASQKKTLWAHQARHPSKAPHPYQDRLLGCCHARVYRSRSGLPLRQLREGRVHPFGQRHRHSVNLGGNSRRYGQGPSGSA